MLPKHWNAATNRRDDILKASADQLKILKSRGLRYRTPCRRFNVPSPSD